MLRIAALLFLTCSLSLSAHARCKRIKDAPVKIRVKSCKVLNPMRELKLTEHAMGHFYTGALIEASDGKKYFRQSPNEHVCALYPEGTEIKMMLARSCCDTGSWGKCRFGGLFIYEPGERPTNAYQ